MGGIDHFFSRIDKYHVWISLFLLIFTIFWFGMWSEIGVDPHHDGTVLKPAVDVARGQMLFRDTYYHYGAFTTLLQAATILLFGEKLIVLRYLTVLFYAGTVVLLYGMSRKFLNPAFVWIPLFLFYLHAPFYFWEMQSWSSVYANFFALLACVVLVKAIDGNDQKWIWGLCGILSILPFWCRQPCGLIVIASLGTLLLLHWRTDSTLRKTGTRIVCFSCGVLLVSALFLLWIGTHGAWENFILQDFVGPAQFTQSATDDGNGSGLIHFVLTGKIKGFYGTLFIVALIWTLLLLYRLLVQRNQERRNWQFLPFLLIADMSLHQYYPVPCARHFFWAGFMAYVVYAMTIQVFMEYRGRSPWIRRIFSTIAILLFLFPIASTVKRFYLYQHDPMVGFYSPMQRLSHCELVTHEGPLKGIWIHAHLKQEWDKFFDRVDSLPEQCKSLPVLNFTSEGIYPLFFKNPTNWKNVYYRHNRPKFKPFLESYIDQNHPIILFYDDPRVARFLVKKKYHLLETCQIPPANHNLQSFTCPKLFIAYPTLENHHE